MNTKILSRLEKLENEIGATKQEPMTVYIVAMVAEGQPEKVPVSALSMDGEWQLDRGHNETVEDFKARVDRLLPRSTNGMSMVLFRYEDDEAN